jgi:hypothetical protein
MSVDRMPSVETEILAALAEYLKDPRKVGLDTELAVLARGLCALPLYADMGGVLLIRPSGDVLMVNSNEEWTEKAEYEVVTDPQWISRAYDFCARRYPRLQRVIEQLKFS